MYASMLLTESLPRLLFVLYSAFLGNCSEWQSFHLESVSKCQLQIRHIIVAQGVRLVLFIHLAWGSSAAMKCVGFVAETFAV